MRGRWASAWIVVGQGMRAKALRSSLVVVTLLIGVLAVICVHAASAVAEQAVRARAELQSGRTPTYTAQLDPAQTRALAGGPPPGSAITAGLSVSIGDAPNRSPLQLVAVSGDLRAARPFPVRKGRWLDGDYQSGYVIHLVVNLKAASTLAAAPPSPVMTLAQPSSLLPVAVVGVVDDAEEAATAYARWDEVAAWIPDLSAGGSHAWLHAATPTDLARLEARAAAASGSGAQFSRSDQGDSLAASVAALQTIFMVIAAVALLVAVIAILNIGLATVNERVDELALRRALGTTRPAIVAVMLLEALALGAASAVLALGIAVPLVSPLTHALFSSLPADQPVTFPATGALVGVGAGLLAAAIGGIIPALRAASIPIARVMRA